MKITRHQPDDKGTIQIEGVVRLLTMGLQDNIVTIWAVTDPMKLSGLPTLPMKFLVKQDDNEVTNSQLVNNRYITSFINDKDVWHLFAGDPPKVMPAHVASRVPGVDGPGTHAPDGGLLR